MTDTTANLSQTIERSLHELAAQRYLQSTNRAVMDRLFLGGISMATQRVLESLLTRFHVETGAPYVVPNYFAKRIQKNHFAQEKCAVDCTNADFGKDLAKYTEKMQKDLSGKKREKMIEIHRGQLQTLQRNLEKMVDGEKTVCARHMFFLANNLDTTDTLDPKIQTAEDNFAKNTQWVEHVRQLLTTLDQPDPPRRTMAM